MASQGSSEGAAPGPGRSLLYSAVTVAVVLGVIVGAALYVLLGDSLPPHPRQFSSVGGEPDATTLISTLVVIYTFFAAAYGAMAPSLIGKKGRVPAAALVMIFLAVVLDLSRVWNSTGDLYATTMRDLPAGKIYDAASEFTRYLFVNVGVLLFALAVACWPAERWSAGWWRHAAATLRGLLQRRQPGQAESRVRTRRIPHQPEDAEQ